MEIEVSLKVRSAIKAKLLELGVHVDEELPDYVMVLVANRRTKEEMDSDLSLFLGDNTSRFTAWLSHVLKKLEKVAMGGPVVDGNSANQTTSKDSPRKTSESEDSSAGIKKTETAGQKKPKKVLVPAVGKRKRNEGDASANQNTSEKRTHSSTSAKKTDASARNKSKEVSVPAVRKTIEEKKHAEAKGKSSNRKEKSASGQAEDSRIKFKLTRPPPGKSTASSERIHETLDTEVKKPDYVVQNEPDSSSTSAKPDSDVQVAESSTATASAASDVLNLGIGEELTLPPESEPVDVPKSSATKNSSVMVVADVNTTVDSEPQTRKQQEVVQRKSEPSSGSKRKLAREGVEGVLKFIKLAEEEQGRSSKKKRIKCPPPRPAPSPPPNHSHRSKLRSHVTVPRSLTAHLEEYDPAKPKLSSVISVTSRQRPRGSHEANKSLIFKAMRDAEADKLKSYSSRRKDRSESPYQERVRRRSRSRSRSPLMKVESQGRIRRDRNGFFTTRKTSIKDRLGAKPERREYQEAVYGDEEYYYEDGDLIPFRSNRDFTLIVKVPNSSTNRAEDEDDQEKSLEFAPEPEEQEVKAEEKEEKSDVKEKVTRPTPRISIQLSSSDEETDSEFTQRSPRKVTPSNDTELELTLRRDDELPMPSGSNSSAATKGMDDRMSDLRAKLASLTGKSPWHSGRKVAKHNGSLQPGREAMLAGTSGSLAMTNTENTNQYQGSITLTAAQGGFGSICKFWPTCSFKDSCKFKHPVCKYDTRCTKPGCPYKHSGSGHEFTAVAKPTVKVCTFFPSCHNMSCPFFHPKPCRFGINCTDRSCTHWHAGRKRGTSPAPVELPSYEKLKWTKPETPVPVPN